MRSHFENRVRSLHKSDRTQEDAIQFVRKCWEYIPLAVLAEGTTRHQVMYFLAAGRVRSTPPFGSVDDKNHMILEDVII